MAAYCIRVYSFIPRQNHDVSIASTKFRRESGSVYVPFPVIRTMLTSPVISNDSYSFFETSLEFTSLDVGCR